MLVATDANVRTTQAVILDGFPTALRVAFAGGYLMSFTVVGLGIFGISKFYFLMTIGQDGEEVAVRITALESLAGFGFGALAIALFARVAGVIFKKAANIGTDYVRKVEPRCYHRQCR